MSAKEPTPFSTIEMKRHVQFTISDIVILLMTEDRAVHSNKSNIRDQTSRMCREENVVDLI